MFEAATLIQSSWLLIPEVQSAIARARRDGRLRPAGLTRAREVLAFLSAEIEVLDVDEPLAARAGTLAATLGLRGSDAVHLASYELIEDEASVLVAADGELSRAALALGYAVAVPTA